ncbi:hypothetical protein KKH46_03055 [Patescibacteria group bacterium]|nr:hypothetical protein [Patescibacteria group bacterium]MBU1956453.1 hypothetical protein [Patescibacteria group bacterium]
MPLFTSIYLRLEERRAFPNFLNLTYEKVGELRYGENPHQKACFYREARIEEPSVGGARLLQGKELSLRDEEVIKAADEHNLALVFTGVRHFRH